MGWRCEGKKYFISGYLLEVSFEEMGTVSNFLHEILIILSDSRSKGGLLPVRMKKDVKDFHSRG